jgi:hypothetical protein
VHKLADDQPQPGCTPFFSMGRGVATELDPPSAQGWLDLAMTRQTDSTDTHPALSDRLKAIGEAPRMALPAVEQAADRLLGSALEVVTASFDQRWKEQVAPAWQERYRKMQAHRRRLDELNARYASGAELTLEEAYDRAMLAELAGNDADGALAQLRALHERGRDDARVCFGLGVRLLALKDASGVALVERAMQLDEDAILSGSGALRDYHWRIGRQEEAFAWHQRMIERAQLLEAARRERDQVSVKEKFDRHGLSDAELSRLRESLRAIPGLRKAYFVKKRVRYLQHATCYVLGYRVTAWYQLHNKARAQEVLRGIKESIRFPGETLIMNVEGPYSQFGRRFRWMRGARVV